MNLKFDTQLTTILTCSKYTHIHRYTHTSYRMRLRLAKERLFQNCSKNIVREQYTFVFDILIHFWKQPWSTFTHIYTIPSLKRLRTLQRTIEAKILGKCNNATPQPRNCRKNKYLLKTCTRIYDNRREEADQSNIPPEKLKSIKKTKKIRKYR